MKTVFTLAKLLPMVVLPLLFWGCQNRMSRMPLLKQSDSLLVKLDSSARYFNRIDTLILKNRMKQCRERVLQLEAINTTKADSLALRYGNKYTIYKHFLKKYPKLKMEMEFSRRQLQDLRHDLQYGLLEQGKDTLYYNQERKALNHLRREISLYYHRILEQNRQLDELNKVTEKMKSTH